jgi:hypothetical protein
MNDTFVVFARWLEWLDSHDGRLYRRSRGGLEDDFDVACTVPGPPGSALVTVGDLRALVAAGRELDAFRAGVREAADLAGPFTVWTRVASDEPWQPLSTHVLFSKAVARARACLKKPIAYGMVEVRDAAGAVVRPAPGPGPGGRTPRTPKA